MRYIESLRESLHGAMSRDSRVYVIGEDILDPYGGAFKVTKGLSTAFPGRILTTPISEAGLTGAAIGMALRGLRPVVEIMFGDFVTLAADQIINNAAKFRWMYNEKVSVPLVIRLPMGGYRGYGPTHSQSLESIFMSVPGIFIVSPSLYHSPGDLLLNSIEQDDVVLFVEHKALYSRPLFPGSETPGRPTFQRSQINPTKTWPTVRLSFAPNEKPDITVISYGHAASLAAEAAADLFMEEELIVDVLVASCLKPVPVDDFLPSIKHSGRVVVVEEGHRTGGWGAEVSSLIHEQSFRQLHGPVIRVAAMDVPIPSARALEEEVLPSVLDVRRSIVRALKTGRED
jgi:pyruvate/2-oxoglutarate/acetoin dehydrogenase E1 component